MIDLYDYLHLSLGYSWPSTILIACAFIRIPASIWDVWGDRWEARETRKWKTHEARVIAAAEAGDVEKAARLQAVMMVNRTPLGFIDKSIRFIGLLPFQIGLVLVTKRLAALPVADLAHASLAWIPSLAAPDPYYILPALNLLASQTVIWHGKLNIGIGINNQMFVVQPTRFLAIPAVAWLAGQSGALNFLVLSYAALVILHKRVLGMRKVRRALGLSIDRDRLIPHGSIGGQDESSSSLPPAAPPLSLSSRFDTKAQAKATPASKSVSAKHGNKERARRHDQPVVPDQKKPHIGLGRQVQADDDVFEERRWVPMRADDTWAKEQQNEQDLLWDSYKMQQEVKLQRKEVMRHGGVSAWSPTRIIHWMQGIIDNRWERIYRMKDEECKEILMEVEKRVEERVREGMPRKILSSEQVRVDLAMQWLTKRKVIVEKKRKALDDDA
jgi:hypothetical protein